MSKTIQIHVPVMCYITITHDDGADIEATLDRAAIKLCENLNEADIEFEAAWEDIQVFDEEGNEINDLQ